MLLCVILVDGFDFEFENRTCSSKEDCPNTTACIDGYCIDYYQDRKIYGGDCQVDQECLKPLICKHKKCECPSHQKWLRTECVCSSHCVYNSDSTLR